METKKKIDILAALEEKGLYRMLAATERKANKKSRKTGAPTPGKYSTVYQIKLCTVSLMNDYEDAVNSRRLKEGMEPDFKAQSTWYHPYSGPVVKHKTKDEHYLRVYHNLNQDFCAKTFYFDAEGNELSRNEWKTLQEEFFALPSESASQELENPIRVAVYKIENVLGLKRGDFVMSDVDHEVSAFIKNRA